MLLMRHKLKKKYDYEEYVINEGFFKKLYLMYMDKPWYNKLLDKLVVIAMLTIFISVLNYFFELPIPSLMLIIVNTISSFVLLVFALELVRQYMHSKSKSEFLRNHWIDFVLVSFLSFYFLFIGMVGLFKLWIIDVLKPLFYDAKDARVLFKLFKRE